MQRQITLFATAVILTALTLAGCTPPMEQPAPGITTASTSDLVGTTVDMVHSTSDMP